MAETRSASSGACSNMYSHKWCIASASGCRSLEATSPARCSDQPASSDQVPKSPSISLPPSAHWATLLAEAKSHGLLAVRSQLRYYHYYRHHLWLHQKICARGTNPQKVNSMPWGWAFMNLFIPSKILGYTSPKTKVYLLYPKGSTASGCT